MYRFECDPPKLLLLCFFCSQPLRGGMPPSSFSITIPIFERRRIISSEQR